MDTTALTDLVRTTALKGGADLVGFAPVSRFEHAPEQCHPRGIFSHTKTVIAVACRMVRGALKTIEEGNFWQAYNCDSYQYLNEIMAPHLLRKITMQLEDAGYTAVPLHNPFAAGQGKPVRNGGTEPDGNLSLRVIGVAAGLGELGLSKLFLSREFGPRNRVFALYTDAELEPTPLVPPGSICDNCGACRAGCPANALPAERTHEIRIGEYVYTHADLDCAACSRVHQGWDPKYSPFLKEDSTRENQPYYYQFLQRRFRHQSICGARGCVRACMDHLEKKGVLKTTYRTPMIEGKQWVIE